MAANDIKITRNPGPTITWDVDDRTTSSQTTNLLPGEPIKKSTNYAIAVATGDPEVGTDEFIGIVRKQSTETSTVDGKVEAYSLIPGATVLRGQATTTTNVDTAADLLGLMGDWVAFDVTGAGTNGSTGVFTIDEDEADDPNVHGLKIIGGNTTKGWLEVLPHSMSTWAGTTI